MATQTECPNCGYRDTALGDAGAAVVVHGWSPQTLKQLFSEDLRLARCKVCAEVLEVDLSVICVFEEPPSTDVVKGSRAGQMSTADFGQTFGPFAAMPVFHQTTDQLIDRVAGLVSARLALLNEYALAIADNSSINFLEENWRRFTPEVMAAGAVVLTTPIPRVTPLVILTTGADSGCLDPLQYLADLQADLWLAMSVSWMKKGDSADLLQSDLDRYITKRVVIPAAIPKFNRAADSFLCTPDLPLECVYILRAVLAAVQEFGMKGTYSSREWALALVSFEFACRRNPEIVSAYTRRIRVSEEFARRTITYNDAWWATTTYLASFAQGDAADLSVAEDAASKELQILGEVVIHLGYDSIFNRIITASLTYEVTAERLLADVDLFRQQRLADVEGVLAFIKQMDGPLLRLERADELELLADGLIERFGTDGARAAVEAWLGSRLKHLRLPGRFLARVGVEAQRWEAGLDGSLAAPLLTERSNALRLAGQPDAALSVARHALEALPDNAAPEDVVVGKMNVAILLREAGAPDAALKVLEELALTAPAANKLRVFQAKAATLAALGRRPEAVVTLEEALGLVVGVSDGDVTAMRAMILNLVVADDPESAMETVRELLSSSDTLAQSSVLLPVAAAVEHVLARAPQLIENSELEAIFGGLVDVGSLAMDYGDVPTATATARILAQLQERLGAEDAEQDWLLALTLGRELGSPDDASVLIHLATYAYRRNDLSEARTLLEGAPSALRGRYGGAMDLGTVARGGEELREAIDILMGELVDLTDRSEVSVWADLRYAADLRRNAVARAMLSSSVIGPGEIWPSDFQVSKIATPSNRNVAVIEWVETRHHFIPLLTTILASGEVRSQFLQSPNEDLAAVASRLPSIVRGWRRGREGDPLDNQEWQTIVAWWQQALVYGGLVEGDHVVVLEHPILLGLPWQAACGAQWTCSYAAGWFALLSCQDLESPKSVGIVRVPKYGDAEEVVVALHVSAERTGMISHQRNLPLTVLEGPEADAEAVKRLLRSVDVAKLLCHGYMDAKTNEVGLAVAADGALPLRQSIAAGTPQGRRHRLDWTELQGLGRAPQVVFSLACLSGVVHSAGLGERLGLFAALSASGTAALIAPRWEVPPREVAPILDAALELWLKGDMDLAQALQRSCVAASEWLPPRYAWALMLEGRWK